MIYIDLDCSVPTCCDECPFLDDSGDYPYCRVLQQNRGYTFATMKKRFPNCPLKQMEMEKDDDKEKERLKDMCRVLFNRCRAVSSAGGALCIFCGMKEECQEMHSI